MDGLIVFDKSNDLIYKKLNTKMKDKIRELALTQELVAIDVAEDQYLHNDILMQLFSPIITSQRIMFCQFDNTYTAFQCENNLNFVFDEYLGYLFLKIGVHPLEHLRRKVGVCIAFARRVCGADLYILKSKETKAELLTNIIDTWEDLYSSDQDILLEAVEQLLVNVELKNVAQKTLEAATEKLKQDPHSLRSHALIFVDKKFLGIFSSKQAQKISPSDILFLSIFSKSLQKKMSSKAINIQSHLVFLQGQTSNGLSGCIPHIVHTSILDKGVVLILLIEYGNLQVSSGLYDTFFALQKTINVQMQGDLENLRSSFDSLELYVKQTLEAMKKAKYNSQEIEVCARKFNIKWDTLKKKYLDFFKNSEKDLIVKIESNIPAFSDELKELFKLTCVECGVLEHGFERVSEISTLVEEKLLEFSEFLSVKAQRNLSMGSYLEEFPGLVHFIYLDRSLGRITAPDLVGETQLIPKEKVWSMVEFSRSYITKGHTSLMWKDTAFNYSYFLWFEDQNGVSVKPKDLPSFMASSTPIRPQYEPGILAGDYYQRLCETCFPKTPLHRLKCYELYCIHLGLVTATCVLEHCRRLGATINDVTGGAVFEFI